MAEPAGAFYALPDVSDYVGPGANAKGFGPIPDVDTLCRCCHPSQVRQLPRHRSATFMS